MKTLTKSILCISLALLICLYSGSVAFAATSYGFTGTLLDTSLILDGEENIIVNEDGSWTVTGDFTLSFPMNYDYRMDDYMFLMNAKSEGGYFDFELDLQVGPDTIVPTTIGKCVGNPNGFKGDVRGDVYISTGFRSYYRKNQKAGNWESGWYQVSCTTLTYRADSATETTIKEFFFAPAVGTVISGDVNQDGATDTADARDLLFALLGEESGELRFIDIDRDQEFTTADVRVLLNKIAA